ncbi:MAG: glycosyltransferase family 4 protein [Deltaproteobacteria bacterium]|nr:glycosyltransferase family 4 protein [Deltaproteobacteria bacterium]
MKTALIVSSRVPYPPNAGFKKRILKLSEFLREDGYRVTLFCLTNSQTDLSRLGRECSTFDRIIAVPFSLPTAVLRTITSLLTGQPIQTQIYRTSKARKVLRAALLSLTPSVVIWNHVRMVEYARISPRIGRWVLDYHDSLSLYYSTVRKYTRWPWQMIYRYEEKRLRIYESQALTLFDKALVTSPLDKNEIEPRGKKIVVLPMGVESDLLNIEPCEKENSISFIGKLDYHPNEDAILFFLANVFSQYPDPTLKFHIVGSNATQRIRKAVAKEPRAVLQGYLVNPYPLLARSKLIVAPVRMGGGVQNKILEGMALGKCVITFTSRLAGLPNIENGKHLVAVEDEMAYVRAFELMMADPIKRRDIGAHARQYIHDRWTWPTLKKAFLAALDAGQE